MERGSVEHEALNAIRAEFAERSTPFTDPSSFLAWLAQAARASESADAKLQGQKLRNAPKFAAQALRATFEHHKLKVSLQANEKKQSDAVKLLCAIAKDGGDPSMTPEQARDWLAGSVRK